MALKKVDKNKNPGLAKLPEKVRNNMGYLKNGGKIMPGMKKRSKKKKKNMKKRVKKNLGGTMGKKKRVMKRGGGAMNKKVM